MHSNKSLLEVMVFLPHNKNLFGVLIVCLLRTEMFSMKKKLLMHTEQRIIK